MMERLAADLIVWAGGSSVENSEATEHTVLPDVDMWHIESRLPSVPSQHYAL